MAIPGNPHLPGAPGPGGPHPLPYAPGGGGRGPRHKHPPSHVPHHHVGKGPKKKRRKPDWGNWNPVAPGPLPGKFRHLLRDYLNRQVGAYANPRQRAITGFTKALSGELGDIAPRIGQAYNQAVGQGTALENALANRLTGAGEATAGELQQALAASGQAVDPALAAAQTAVGVGNASFAQGSYGLQQLIAQGAASQAYGAKLPGIAALGGLQASRGLQAQAQSMIPDLQNQFFSNELQKYIARTQFGMSKAELKQRKREAKIGHREFLAGLKLDNRKFLADQYDDIKGDASAAQKEKLQAIDGAISDAIDKAEDWRKGDTSGDGLGGTGGGGINLKVAYQRVLNRLQHDLRRYGVSKSKLRNQAVYVLRQAGYKIPPGYHFGPAGHVGDTRHGHAAGD